MRSLQRCLRFRPSLIRLFFRYWRRRLWRSWAATHSATDCDTCETVLGFHLRLILAHRLASSMFNEVRNDAHEDSQTTYSVGYGCSTRGTGAGADCRNGLLVEWFRVGGRGGHSAG